MSRIKEIREAIATKLDKWEAEAAAFEAQLNPSKDKATERLETQKKQFADVLTKIKAKGNKLKAIAEEEKTQIQNQLEHLQVQLALSKAESKAAYESQKKAIEDAIMSFETSIDCELDETADALLLFFLSGKAKPFAQFSSPDWAERVPPAYSASLPLIFIK